MKPALLLVDLQADFLDSPNVMPAAASIVSGACGWLQAFRQAQAPVIHVWTSVNRADDRRMSHWRREGRWSCEEGTRGHRTPDELVPQPDESIIHKQHYSAFSTGALDRLLDGLDVDTLIVGGVHLHACVRETLVDAHARGLRVVLADDAVGSDDAVGAASARRWLVRRFVEVATAADRASLLSGGPLGAGGDGGKDAVERACAAAVKAQAEWSRREPRARMTLLESCANALTESRDELVATIVAEVGKPVKSAEAEHDLALGFLRGALAAGPCAATRTAGDVVVRRVPLGVVAVLSPFNNPLAIAIGKLAPALLHGNAVVWKPSPLAAGVAARVLLLLEQAGFPPGLVSVVEGDGVVGATLMDAAPIAAVTLTGSEAAGEVAREACARRRIPLQAELGGNNAAVVWTGADLTVAAARIVRGAFGDAGQRCTANRRVIVRSEDHDAFVALLVAETAALAWGRPEDPATVVGPLVNAGARDRVHAMVERARRRGWRVLRPHLESPAATAAPSGPADFAPALLVDGPGGAADGGDEAAGIDEIVREETFGPVLVVQRADDFEHALQLVGSVRQQLVAALFGGDEACRERFLTSVQAGLLKFDAATAGAEAAAPFGGWGASGVGPPEHGPADIEFYTRWQSVYGAPERW